MITGLMIGLLDGKYAGISSVKLTVMSYREHLTVCDFVKEN